MCRINQIFRCCFALLSSNVSNAIKLSHCDCDSDRSAVPQDSATQTGQSAWPTGAFQAYCTLDNILSRNIFRCTLGKWAFSAMVVGSGCKLLLCTTEFRLVRKRSKRRRTLVHISIHRRRTMLHGIAAARSCVYLVDVCLPASVADRSGISLWIAPEHFQLATTA